MFVKCEAGAIQAFDSSFKMYTQWWSDVYAYHYLNYLRITALFTMMLYENENENDGFDPRLKTKNDLDFRTGHKNFR